MSRYSLLDLVKKSTEKIGILSRAAAHVIRLKLREYGLTDSHTEYTPFIILGHGRTGSTMLVSMLQSHPKCVCYSELFHPHSPKWFYEHINFLHGKDGLRNEGHDKFLKKYVYKRTPTSIKAVGFKVLYCNINEGSATSMSGEGEIKRTLRYMKDIGVKVIHIKRKNKLKRFVSMKMANKRKKWVIKKRGGISDRTKINVDTEEMLRSMERHFKLEKEKEKIFSCFDYINVSYENLCEKKDDIEKIQNFLGLPVRSLRASTARTRRRSLREVIENYGEVIEALRSTKYEEFIP
ncbi:MAG: Stf0 family sulfotransferase [Salinibacter sp.]|uniref:Stf0 family sulfotransferase n=1 Tax=Salinibacter sp. TaxID=2065818 RepID=UPI0035D499F6